MCWGCWAAWLGPLGLLRRLGLGPPGWGCRGWGCWGGIASGDGGGAAQDVGQGPEHAVDQPRGRPGQGRLWRCRTGQLRDDRVRAVEHLGDAHGRIGVQHRIQPRSAKFAGARQKRPRISRGGRRADGGAGARVSGGQIRGQVHGQRPRDVGQRGADRLQRRGKVPGLTCSGLACVGLASRLVRHDLLAEFGGHVEAFGQQRPRGVPVRQQIVALVEQLEARAGADARVAGPGREGGDQIAERLDDLEHQCHRRVRERLELGVGLIGMREEALEDLQQDLVGHVEQVHDLGGDRIVGQRHLDVAVARPDVDRQHRAGRHQAAVRLAGLLELVQDGDELAKMSGFPVPARALALLQDLVDGPLRRGQVGHRDQFGPAEVLLRRLGPRRPDEQPLLAVLGAQVRETSLDRPVHVPDRREVLPARHDVAGHHVRHRAAERCEPVAVVQVHALGTLEEHEVPQRLLPERQQRQVNPGGIVAGRVGEVRPGQVRRGADRGQQVLHQRQVQHFLRGDVRDDLAPAPGGGQFFGREALALVLLEGERREQVLAHDAVLQFCGLAQHVDQRLAVLDHERCLRRGQAAAGGDDLRQPSALGGGRRGRHGSGRGPRSGGRRSGRFVVTGHSVPPYGSVWPAVSFAVSCPFAGRHPADFAGGLIAGLFGAVADTMCAP